MKHTAWNAESDDRLLQGHVYWHAKRQCYVAAYLEQGLYKEEKEYTVFREGILWILDVLKEYDMKHAKQESTTDTPDRC